MSKKPLYDFTYSGFGVDKENIKSYLKALIIERRSIRWLGGDYRMSSGLVESMISSIANNDYSFNADDPAVCKLLEDLIVKGGYDPHGHYSDDARIAMRNLCIALGKDPDEHLLFDKNISGRLSRLKHAFGVKRTQPIEQIAVDDNEHIAEQPTQVQNVKENEEQIVTEQYIEPETVEPVAEQETPAQEQPPVVIQEDANTNPDAKETAAQNVPEQIIPANTAAPNTANVIDEELERQLDLATREYVLDEAESDPLCEYNQEEDEKVDQKKENNDKDMVETYEPVSLDEKQNVTPAEPIVTVEPDKIEPLPENVETAQVTEQPVDTILETDVPATDNDRIYIAPAVDTKGFEEDEPVELPTPKAEKPAKKSKAKKFMYKITLAVAGLAAVGAGLFMANKAKNNSIDKEPEFKTVKVDTVSHKTVQSYDIRDAVKANNAKSRTATDSVSVALTRSSKSSLNILLGEKKADELCARVQCQIDAGIFVAPRGMSAERIAHAMEMSRVYEGKSIVLDALESTTKLTPQQQAAFNQHIDEIGDMGVGIQKRMASKHKLSKHSKFNKAPKTMRNLHVKNIKQLHQLRQQMARGR